MRTILLFFILLTAQVGFGAILQSEIKTNAQMLKVYTIQAKDTWTNLSKKFYTSIKELQAANVGVTDLKIGQVIKVPSVSAAKEIVAPQKEKTSPSISKPVNVSTGKNPIYYTVKAHETLYHISKVKNISVDDLKKWNNLSSNNVSVDQRLIVGYEAGVKAEKIVEPVELKKTPVNEAHGVESVASKKEEVIEVKSPVVKKEAEVKEDTSANAIKEGTTAINANKVTETGVVSWFGDGDLNQNKFYALHRTAAIGTIIKVTNRMNNNSVFVKVVGALPTTGDNENIILKITQAAAQRIGALDQKFQAELSYVIAQ